MQIPSLPDSAVTALILLGVEAVLVFLASQHMMMLRGKLGIAGGIVVIYRLALFTFGLLIVGVFGFFSVGPIFCAVQVAFALLEAVLLFRFWPSLYQSMNGTALGNAVIGGIITMIGMGASAIAVLAKNWGSLLPTIAITAVGGFMLYDAIKKLMAGE